jgi:hypothetical protein
MPRLDLNYKNISTTKWISSKPWPKSSPETSTGNKLTRSSNKPDTPTEAFSKESTRRADWTSTLVSVNTTTSPASAISDNYYLHTTTLLIPLKRAAQASLRKWTTIFM